MCLEFCHTKTPTTDSCVPVYFPRAYCNFFLFPIEMIHEHDIMRYSNNVFFRDTAFLAFVGTLSALSSIINDITFLKIYFFT